MVLRVASHNTHIHGDRMFKGEMDLAEIGVLGLLLKGEARRFLSKSPLPHHGIRVHYSFQAGTLYNCWQLTN